MVCLKKIIQIFKIEVKEIWTSDIETKVKDFSTRVSVTNTPFIIYISGIVYIWKVLQQYLDQNVNMIVTVNQIQRRYY
mgnify:CR=1 FL=1